ncbi:tRNA(m(1)G37)methyltransferase, partial [Pseudocyphellaria aurata]|nr:tRNA(m(1)G37)methyltransferase [Pseudocyphellaria aurata]
MFRPPVNRLMKILDRSFFKKSIPSSAAQVNDDRRIASLVKELTQDTLHSKYVRGRGRVVPAPNGSGLKALLLKPEIKADDTATWSKKLQDLVSAEQIAVIPYDLEMDYDCWNYHDIMSAILPEDDSEELPSSFSRVGHIAHLNLRGPYLPYKTLIADVIMDKNPGVRTVINKIDDVGTESEYRTFNYELLAGDPDMKVETKKENCTFRFDYSKVYWNPRLDTEHRRLIDQFQPGEAVCDVMAGVGPFAVPAGKKKVFVWANDLNPESYKSLQAAIDTNKVREFVRPSNQDGRVFIRSATQSLLQTNTYAKVSVKSSLNPSPSTNPHRDPKLPRTSPRRRTPRMWDQMMAPKTFSHYVMNLPAIALTFLPSFIGLYAGHEALFAPHGGVKLPLIHVYCFVHTKDMPADGRDRTKAIRTHVRNEIASQLHCDSFRHTAAVDEDDLVVFD